MKSLGRYLSTNKLCCIDTMGFAIAGFFLGSGSSVIPAIGIIFLALIAGYVVEGISR